MTDPKPTPISEHLHKTLQDAGKEIAAINQMMDMFQKQVADRLARAEMSAGRAWELIKKETGVDLDNIQWVPSEHRPEIIPVAMKLTQK